MTPRVGYLPERPPVFSELTGRENLRYVAGLRGLEVPERIERLLERFDLADAVDRSVSGYSKGMKQKLGLVGALVHEPEVLFLDEPTSGLDPRAARTVRDTVDQTAADGVTVFLSTHVLPIAEELADRVGVLDDGRLVAEGPPEDLVRRAEAGDDGSLEDAFMDVTRARRDRTAAEER